MSAVLSFWRPSARSLAQLVWWLCGIPSTACWRSSAHLISLSLLFLLLRSEFVAAVQVVVYAGAVMVLYVFVVAYVGGEGDSIGERLRGRGAVGSASGCARRRDRSAARC